MTCASFSEIYFVRHGETDWNVQGRIQGHTDIPLNETGLLQAASLRELLAEIPFSAAFSSDLSRAHQTAELIIQPRSIPIVATGALRERSAGNLEGQSTDQLDQRVRSFFLSEHALHQESYFNIPWHPELETGKSVLQRVFNFIFSYLDRFYGQPILIVSHGGVLRSLLDYLSFKPLHRWTIANCGFVKIKIEQRQFHLMHCHGVSCRSMSL